MKNFLQKTKSGATSIYVVVFASLLFTVIAVGFVTVIMSEVTQTINDELSNSARDAALAGIEDAKLAIIKCASNELDGATCSSKMGRSVEDGGCDTVSSLLNRETTDDNAVLVTESASATSTDDQKTAQLETLQAYTCVTVNSKLPDYRSSLSFTDTDTVRVIPLTSANIASVRINWFAASDSNDYAYRNTTDDGTKASFAPISEGISVPPTISAELIQTQSNFTLNSSEIDYTNTSNQTDRGTLVLVPSNKAGVTQINNSGTTASQSGPVVATTSTQSGFVKANNKARNNNPYIIKCDESAGREFICTATIQLPSPVGGTRNASSTALVLSLLYDQPHTSFSIEMLDSAGNTIPFDGAQYAIDSTGRANDVYSRVEARVELSDIYFPYPKYAVQLGDGGLTKNFWVTNAPAAANSYTGCWHSTNTTLPTPCTTNSGDLADNHS